MQHIQHRLHGLGHGVVAGEAVVGEKCVEYRLCDEMLGQHLYDFDIRNLVIEIVTQLPGERIEGFARRCLRRVFQQRLDSVDMGIGDLGDIIRPVFPMVAIATLVHHFGVQRAFDLTDLEGHLELVRRRAVDFGLLTDGVFAFSLIGRADFQRAGFALDGIGDGNDFHLAAVRANQIQLVDHRVEAIIVRA